MAFPPVKLGDFWLCKYIRSLHPLNKQLEVPKQLSHTHGISNQICLVPSTVERNKEVICQVLSVVTQDNYGL